MLFSDAILQLVSICAPDFSPLCSHWFHAVARAPHGSAVTQDAYVNGELAIPRRSDEMARNDPPHAAYGMVLGEEPVFVGV